MNHKSAVSHIQFGLVGVDEINDGGCFTGSGGAIKEEVREIIRFQDIG